MNDNVSKIYDTEVEQQVLGAMMIRNGEKIPAVLNILNAQDFYFSDHRLFFNSIVRIYTRGIALEFLTVLNELKKSDAIDSNYAFKVLEGSTYTNAYIEQHARIVKENSKMRRLKSLSANLAAEIERGKKSATDIVGEISTEFSHFTSTNETSKFFAKKDFFTNDFKSEIAEMKKYSSRGTGFSNIDENQIFSPGLYVLGATPAAGKTTFAWQMAEQLAQNGEACIFCSYEMSKLELFTKSIATELFKRNPKTTLTAAEIRRGGWSNEVDEVIAEQQNTDSDLRVLELHDESVDDLLKILRPVCTKKFKSPIVFIDYLQIIPSSKDGIKIGIDDTVRKLKVFQRETNTTFIVISSLNRQNYNQQIAFESFKESGNIEFTADVVWGLQLNVVNQIKSCTNISGTRQKIDEAKKQKPRQIHLKCLKNRQGFNYDCYFKYFSAHDFFIPCEEKDFETASDGGIKIDKNKTRW